MAKAPTLFDFVWWQTDDFDYAVTIERKAKGVHLHPTKGWKGPRQAVAWKREFIRWRQRTT